MINKLRYVRVCILELSKTPMCQFHFDYLKNKHATKSGLLLTDTDNLAYETETKNVYQNYKNEEMFDFNNFFCWVRMLQ